MCATHGVQALSWYRVTGMLTTIMLTILGVMAVVQNLFKPIVVFLSRVAAGFAVCYDCFHLNLDALH